MHSVMPVSRSHRLGFYSQFCYYLVYDPCQARIYATRSVISAVWIALFALMGLSLFLIWRKGISGADRRIALGVFAAQLLVNVLWSYAFFGLQSPLAGVVVILVLWLLILQNIIRFWSISKDAALLLSSLHHPGELCCFSQLHPLEAQSLK